MTTETQPTRMTHAEWKAEAERRFGKDMMNWKFVCPSCGHVQSTKDYKEAGAQPSAVGFSCVGRYLKKKKSAFGKKGPCDYAGGGLIRLNPITVVHEDGEESQAFAFAEADSGTSEVVSKGPEKGHEEGKEGGSQ